jgi:hypothetical protein
MTAKRTGRFSLREDRQLIQMAAKSVSSEEAAAMFGSYNEGFAHSRCDLLFGNRIRPKCNAQVGDKPLVQVVQRPLGGFVFVGGLKDSICPAAR